MINRREFIGRMTAVGAMAGGLNAMALISDALAKLHYTKGVIKVEGEVILNGSPAAKGSNVSPGDVITTGKDSSAVIVVGKNCFLMRDNSHVELGKDNGGLLKEIKVKAGKLLSVFEKGEKRLVTATAIAGIRGSAMYVEAESDVTYFCLCYGSALIEASSFMGINEAVNTKHHEAPRYVLAQCAGKPILPAPMLNHTDDELEMLDALVGRKTPFAVQNNGSGGGY